MADAGQTLVALDEVHAFVVRCMTACRVCKEHAEALADLVVAADYRGHYSHGITRLYMYTDMYVNAVNGKGMATEGSPKILKETVATALVDGQHLIGPVTGRFCMDLAIEKAKNAGIGWVSARGCTHFGIAGWYGNRATEQGMLGMAFTNTIPILAPTRAKKAVFGTNPLCLSAPGKDGDSFLLDMATTTVANGKVVVADRKNQQIPKGWALDKDGNPVTDPKQAKMLSPLGGEEKTSGYKGYGLAMMVDIFTGVLSGGNYGHHVPNWRQTHEQPNMGCCFVAINPDAFAEGFTDRMSDLMNYCRSLEPVEGEGPVMVAGDPERKHMKKCDEQGGVYYHQNVIQSVNTLATSLNVEPLRTVAA